jgi:hypothetical protein
MANMTINQIIIAYFVAFAAVGLLSQSLNRVWQFSLVAFALFYVWLASSAITMAHIPMETYLLVAAIGYVTALVAYGIKKGIAKLRSAS